MSERTELKDPKPRCVSCRPTLVDRGRDAYNRGNELEYRGAVIPGLWVLDRMISPNSPVRPGELRDQVLFVEHQIAEANRQLGQGARPEAG